MRVVFFGTPEFAVPSLEALLDTGIDVVGVVTQPDRAQGRSHSTLIAPPVKRTAIARGLSVLQPERPRGPDFLAAVRSMAPDLGVVVAYGHLLPDELLAIPRHGMVNLHASILPRWRGAAPVQWSVLAGDAETGASVMRVERGLDSGAVWDVVRTPIGDTDTTGVLLDRLAHLGSVALIDTLPRIAAGEAPSPQPVNGVTHAPKIDRDLARIDWSVGARAISQRIRAMDPAPGAWTTIGGEMVKFFGADVLRDLTVSDEPGVIDLTSPGPLLVSTRDGTLAVSEVQPAGRRRMRATEWLRGAGATAASRFA